VFVHCAKTVAARAALSDLHSCADGRQPDLLSPTESRWIFLNIVWLHISLTQSRTHPLSLSLSLFLSLTYPKTHRLVLLDIHGLFREINLEHFIHFSYMGAQSSIECGKYGVQFNSVSRPGIRGQM
jgi:hypothetical protein